MLDLQREKEVLAKKVQSEEENLHLNLRRRLKELQQEKVDTENMLEIEQEQIVNKLSKELADAITEKK
jgi:transcription initiation factor TFIID subunit TAF12